MPFYRSNPKSGGGGADYDSFYITVGQDKYLPTSDFLKKQFPNNYNTSFNESIVIGNNVSDCSNFMPNARFFNSPLTIGKRVKYMDKMMERCDNFNQPITIPSYAVNCQNAFYYCNNFNQPITFDNVVFENAYVMFYGLKNYNHPINIVFSANLPSYDNNINMSSMFASCSSYNCPVSIINGKNLSLGSFLRDCTNFNAPFNLVNTTVRSCFSTFASCTNYNQPTNFYIDTDSNGIVSFANVFENTSSFNSSLNLISIGNNEGNVNIMMNWVFLNCLNYNKPFTIPSRTNQVALMFYGCTKFNSPVTFENNECVLNTNCNGLFRYANAFNQAVIFPENVREMYNAFENCLSFGNNVYFKGTTAKYLWATGMFRNCNRSKRKNIWCNAVLTNNFLGNATGNSITGTAITWATITNGYYNATYNIYIYNNYEG